MKNWNNIGAVVLYSKDNRNGRWFNCLEDAVRTLRRNYWDQIDPIDVCNVKGYISFSSYTWSTGRVSTYVYGDQYLIKDDLGLVIPYWKIREVYDNLPALVYRHWRFRGPYKFRDGPVPGSGGWRGGCRGAKKLWQAVKSDYFDKHDEELSEYKFKRRNYNDRFKEFRNWDRNHSDWRDRNWKSFRKTRWK